MKLNQSKISFLPISNSQHCAVFFARYQHSNKSILCIATAKLDPNKCQMRSLITLLTLKSRCFISGKKETFKCSIYIVRGRSETNKAFFTKLYKISFFKSPDSMRYEFGNKMRSFKFYFLFTLVDLDFCPFFWELFLVHISEADT